MPTLPDHYHVGIVVPDLAAARTRLTTLLGVTWGPVMHLDAVDYRDGAGNDLVLPTTMCYSVGDPCLELIEEVPGSVWVRNEHSNLHHIGFWTEGLVEVSAELSGGGCPHAILRPGRSGRARDLHLSPRRRARRPRRARRHIHAGGHGGPLPAGPRGRRGLSLLLRTMEMGDLPLVGHWLAAPHVARWWLAGSSVERELDDLRRSVTGVEPVHALMVIGDDAAIGWCQWYLCEQEPAWAADVGAAPGDVGIDYAVGEARLVGQGIGTALVAALVERVRTTRPGCGVIADPDERNGPSRRVLEKNGFELMRVAALPSEPTPEPVAVYRLPAGT